MRSLIAIVVAATACHSPQLLSRSSAVGEDPCAGSDDTPVVQAAMSSGVCLPAGVYRVDAPALNSAGRRRDAMLGGGVLCGRRDVTILFRGDARQLLWIGVMDADVHDVRLDSSCLSGTVEQTHLVRLTRGHVIRDVALVHPKRATLAGDDVNVVGDSAAPMTGLSIDHVTLESCARYGVHVSRGVSGGRIADSVFGDGCSLGSEDASGVDGLVISHDVFSSTTSGLAINAQRQTNLLISHVSLHGRSLLLFHCDHCTVEHSTVDGLSGRGDWASAVSVVESAHHILLSDLTMSQSSALAAPLVTVGPLRLGRTVDLADVTLDSSAMHQLTAADMMSAQGVAGVTVTNNQLYYEGPASRAAVSLATSDAVVTTPAATVPTTDVVEAGNTLTGMLQ